MNENSRGQTSQFCTKLILLENWWKEIQLRWIFFLDLTTGESLIRIFTPQNTCNLISWELIIHSVKISSLNLPLDKHKKWELLRSFSSISNSIGALKKKSRQFINGKISKSTPRVIKSDTKMEVCTIKTIENSKA